jgi:hypothetical protein
MIILCPQCNEEFSDLRSHMKWCNITVERLINVGVITEEEVENLKLINSNTNKEGVSSTSPILNKD